MLAKPAGDLAPAAAGLSLGDGLAQILPRLC